MLFILFYLFFYVLLSADIFQNYRFQIIHPEALSAYPEQDRGSVG